MRTVATQVGGILGRRSLRIALVIGAVWWLAALLARLNGWISIDLATLLLLVGVAAVVPIALHLALAPSSQALRAAVWIQPLAGALVAVSFVTRPGALAAALTLPWGFVAIPGAFAALTRLHRRGIAVPAEVCVDAGLLYFLIGWTWLFLNRSGLAAQ